MSEVANCWYCWYQYITSIVYIGRTRSYPIVRTSGVMQSFCELKLNNEWSTRMPHWVNKPFAWLFGSSGLRLHLIISSTVVSITYQELANVSCESEMQLEPTFLLYVDGSPHSPEVILIQPMQWNAINYSIVKATGECWFNCTSTDSLMLHYFQVVPKTLYATECIAHLSLRPKLC